MVLISSLRDTTANRTDKENAGAALVDAFKEVKGLEPVQIYEIAEGVREGDAEAARGAFAQVGATLGDVIAMTVSITDGLVVIGGGLAGAYKYMKDAMFEPMYQKQRQ